MKIFLAGHQEQWAPALGSGGLIVKLGWNEVSEEHGKALLAAGPPFYAEEPKAAVEQDGPHPYSGLTDKTANPLAGASVPPKDKRAKTESK